MTHDMSSRLRRALLGLALLGAGMAAHAVVLVEQQFANGLGAFSSTGSVSLVSDGARLRGGSSPGRLNLPLFSTAGHTDFRLTVTRATSGLDTGETAVISASVNGNLRTLESTSSASGSTTFALGNGIATLTLGFAINASSVLETYTITSVRLEATPTSGCEPNCTPSAGTTIVPDASWACGLPNGIPDPSSGTLVFSTKLTRGTTLEVGNTPYGNRRVTPNNGGTLLSNGRVSGSIQSGSLDFDLLLPSGAVEHESRYVLRSGSANVYMRSCGVAESSTEVRFVADFEAPSSSSLQWLNSGTYVGRRKTTPSGVELTLYEVSPNVNPAHAVRRVPADPQLRQQAWNCTFASPSATQGSEVLQARVSIGSSLSVGNSKYGSRNIIPITGGTLSGTLVSGGVNAGGADYQLNPGGGLQIEARYTLKASNGETIVVRNCGNFATADLSQVMFEAKTDGAYAGLNDRRFVGTVTPGLGRVTIKVYDER